MNLDDMDTGDWIDLGRLVLGGGRAAADLSVWRKRKRKQRDEKEVRRRDEEPPATQAA